MSDIVITQIVEPHQTIVVLAGEDYVALELDFQNQDPRKGRRRPDEVVLLGPAGSERLEYALRGARVKAREISRRAQQQADSEIGSA